MIVFLPDEFILVTSKEAVLLFHEAPVKVVEYNPTGEDGNFTNKWVGSVAVLDVTITLPL